MCVGSRNARVSNVRAERTTGTPAVACARQRERACSVISTLCRTGAVAERARRQVRRVLLSIFLFLVFGLFRLWGALVRERGRENACSLRVRGESRERAESSVGTLGSGPGVAEGRIVIWAR